MAYGNSAFYTTDATGAATTTYALPAGSDRVLHIFAIHEENAANEYHSALTFGGVSASKRTTTNGQYEGGNGGTLRLFIEHWYILETNLGSIASNPSIACTLGGSSPSGITGIAVICTTGSEQNPANWGTPVTDNKTNDVTLAATLAGSVGDTFIGAMICSLGGSSFATSIADGVTETADANINGTSTRVGAFYVDLASTSISMTTDNGNNTTTAYQSLMAVRIPQASAGDVTAPVLTSAVVASSGTSLTLNFSETVSIGAGGNGGFTLTASGGAAALTYSSGSGSSALVYTIGRTVSSSETATIAYTQPGNGVEDGAGNDLATFSGTSVTNNSTQGSGPAVTSVSDTTPAHLADLGVAGQNFPTAQSGSAGVLFVGVVETVSLTPTYDTTSALTAAFSLGNNRIGVAGNIVVRNAAGTSSAGYSVTPQPRSGGTYVNLSGTLAETADRITALPDLASGYQLEAYGVEGGTIDDITLYQDGSVRWKAGVRGFWVRAHDGTAWGDPAWQTTVLSSLPSNYRTHSIAYSIR